MIMIKESLNKQLAKNELMDYENVDKGHIQGLLFFFSFVIKFVNIPYKEEEL